MSMVKKYIIYTDMVGDVCHMNHIKHLEKCKHLKIILYYM